MTPVPHLPRADLTASTLLLHPEPHPEVQVVVVDIAGKDPAEVGPLVQAAASTHPGAVGVEGGDETARCAALAAGAGLVIIHLGPDTQGVDDAVRSGAVVVLHHPDLVQAVAVCDRLAGLGMSTTRVVIEVGPHADVVPQVSALERSAFGFGVGACLAPVSGRPLLHHDNRLAHGPRRTDADPSVTAAERPDRTGWEVGALTALLSRKVATVRGVDPARVGRVRAVLGAIDTAAAELDGACGP